MRCLVLGFATLLACGDGSHDTADAAAGGDAANGDAAPSYRAEELATAPYDDGQRQWTNHLVRVTRPDGARTYVQYIPSDKPGPRPVVVMTMPYAGIAWTGEELDTRWAGYPLDASSRHLDVDGPEFDGASLILYDPTPVADADDQAHVHLLNDFAVVLVYGRFYAGGSVRDEIEDMKAGMWFVAEQPEIDRTRVGVFGGSWGGFEALYASAYGDPRARPVVTVADYPPVDFTMMEPYFASLPPEIVGDLAPYVRRIHAGTGGAPGAAGADYSGLRTADLCATLPDKTLVLHDEHDNLVPFAQSTGLLAACGGDAQFWLRTGTFDRTKFTHGPLLDEPSPQAVYTYSVIYLSLALATPEQTQLVGIYSAQSLATHLGLVHAAQAAGRDVAFAAARLRELADPRLLLLSLPDSTVHSGADAAATAVNATWGTSYTATTIRDALATGLPPP